jgi:addiction module HigA family antidote
MSDTQATEYQPARVSHPGKTLKETLKALGMKQPELAKRTGRPLKTINEIINGKASITSETAFQLETVLSVPATFWLNRQNQYDESLARNKQSVEMHQFIAWSEMFPIKEMIKWLGFPMHTNPIDRTKELLSFFGIASPLQWDKYWSGLKAHYRQRSNVSIDFPALSVWLRYGEIEAQKIECKEFSVTKFKSCLKDIKLLTTKSPEEFIPELTKLCASSGVAYVLVRDLPRTYVCGATRWLSSNKALIQQGIRYKTNGQFWFTFFHEAAHIIKHNSEGLILELSKNKVNKLENEANRFASDFLIPTKAYKAFILEEDFSRSSIKAFAHSLKIAPGIIVGRLQHDEYIGFNNFNDMKQFFEWKQS